METLEMPSPELLRSHIPKSHPRLFTRPETVELLRTKRERSEHAEAIWKRIEAKAQECLEVELPDEPPDAFPNGTFDVVEWRKGIAVADTVLSALHSQSFAYLISTNEAYGDAAKRLLLHVAGWDPLGTSGRVKNDEISMRLLYGMSRAYDWLHPLFTPEEGQQVEECMLARGEEVYQTMRRIGFEKTLRDNHLSRSMGFLGEAAIAFMGDFPEAEVWFDYIVGLFIEKYPPWGGAEGGWSQGVGYWQAYINWVLEFLDALKIAAGLDLFNKPFFRNTGYFKFYAHPPQSKIGAFGDGSDLHPNSTSAFVMSHFASAVQNSAFQWYASKVKGITETPVLPKDTFIGYIRAPELGNQPVPAQLPEDLPQSRYFSDIGWVLMNHDLGNWEQNVHVKFKSSPYGSFNHGHAEQNSFILEAYGSPLAISSGYYPWYGSPHHKTWTWESRSKNTILVNGHGQGVQNLDARGRILVTHFGHQFDYVAGDATQAYEGKVKRFVRHLWFIKPNLIAIFDEVEAKGTTTYDWLLHAECEMEVYHDENRVRVVAETADMWATFVHPAGITFHQTDQFTVRPENREAHKPNQWHLSATATEAEGRGRFLVLLNPRPAGDFQQVPASFVELNATNGHAAIGLWQDRELSILFRDEESPDSQCGAVRTDAVGAAWWRSHEGAGVMVLKGTRFEDDGNLLMRSLAGPVTLGIAWEKAGTQHTIHLQADEDANTDIELATDIRPSQIVLNGTTLPESDWLYDAGKIRIHLGS